MIIREFQTWVIEDTRQQNIHDDNVTDETKTVQEHPADTQIWQTQGKKV